jgi:hypothetical protein
VPGSGEHLLFKLSVLALLPNTPLLAFGAGGFLSKHTRRGGVGNGGVDPARAWHTDLLGSAGPPSLPRSSGRCSRSGCLASGLGHHCECVGSACMGVTPRLLKAAADRCVSWHPGLCPLRGWCLRKVAGFTLTRIYADLLNLPDSRSRGSTRICSICRIHAHADLRGSAQFAGRGWCEGVTFILQIRCPG